VTATLGATSKTYDAFALFGEIKSGQQQTKIVDPVTPGVDSFTPNQSANAYTHYPILLLTSITYDSAAGREYLQSSELPDSMCETTEHCFDESSFRFGPSASDVNRRLSTPLKSVIEVGGVSTASRTSSTNQISSATPESEPASGSTICPNYNYNTGASVPREQDTNQHKTGYHFLKSTFTGTCSYEAVPGTKQCLASVTAAPAGYVQGDDQGLNTAGVHVTGVAVQSAAASNGTAQAAVGMAVLNCATANCSVGVSFNAGLNLSYPPSAVWNVTEPYSNTCLIVLLPLSSTLTVPASI
jgi:hypothetical protein